MKLKLMVYDFDGVMTNNMVFINQKGEESTQVNRGDGLAIHLLKNIGMRQIIISTEQNSIVKYRAAKLGIPVLYGIEDKKQALEKYCEENKIRLDRTIFVGNDLNDYDVMCSVGFPISPGDAADEIKSISRYVTKAYGGYGVVRELYSWIVLRNEKIRKP